MTIRLCARQVTRRQGPSQDMGFRRCGDCGGGHCGRALRGNAHTSQRRRRHHRRSSRCEFDAASIDVFARPMGACELFSAPERSLPRCRTDSRALRRKFAYRESGGSSPGSGVGLGRLSRARARDGRELTVRRVVVFGGPRYSTESADVALLVMSTLTTPVSDSSCVRRRVVGCSTSSMVGWSTSNLLPRAVLDARFSRPEKVIAPTVVQASGWCESKGVELSTRGMISAPLTLHRGVIVQVAARALSGAPLVAKRTCVTCRWIGHGDQGPGRMLSAPTHCYCIRISAIRGWITAQLAAANAQGGKDIGATGS